MWYKKNQKTKLPNGKRPRYKDLEASFLKTFEMMETYREQVKRLTAEAADLRHQLQKLKGDIIPDTNDKD